MFTALLITLLVVGFLGHALRSQRAGGAIVHRRYANRYNDAAGAREDHLE